MANESFRVLVDPPLPGAVNMARDEALLLRTGRGDSQATLRFYQWDPPTISLGYFQKYADYEALPDPAGKLAVVRRQTGGGAILHDRELTYSIAVPLTHPILKGGPRRLYEIAHDALIAALGASEEKVARCGFTDDSGPAKGPFFCFARRHSLDVVVNGDKLAGSAQRRTKDAVLQHGSIVLERRYEQQPAAEIRAVAPLEATELATRMTKSLAEITGLTFVAGDWEREELTEAEPLTAKHAGDEWLRRM